MLIEMAITAVATAGAYGGVGAIKNWIGKKPLPRQTKTETKKVSLKPDDVGGYPWAAMYVKTTKQEGFLPNQIIVKDWFKCPKCLSENHTPIKLCADEHYHLDHFDFKCGHCGFECFIRTADQTDDT